MYSVPSTHSCTASFFSSFSSCLGPLNVDVAVVWTPCDVTSSPALFWSGADGDGDSAAGLPGLLVFVVVEDGAGAPPGVPAAITTTPSSAPSRPTVEALSRGRSLGLSAESLGGLVIIWSKAGSEFELDCNWKREDEKQRKKWPTQAPAQPLKAWGWSCQIFSISILYEWKRYLP